MVEVIGMAAGIQKHVGKRGAAGGRAGASSKWGTERAGKAKPTLGKLNRLMAENYAAIAAEAERNTVALTGKARL